MFSIFKKKGVKGQISKGNISEPVISFLKAKDRFVFSNPEYEYGACIWKVYDKHNGIEMKVHSSNDSYVGKGDFWGTGDTSFLTKDELELIYDKVIKPRLDRIDRYWSIKKERIERDKRIKLKKVYCNEG